MSEEFQIAEMKPRVPVPDLLKVYLRPAVELLAKRIEESLLENPQESGANDTAAQTDKEKDLQAAKKPTCEDCGVFLPCKPTEHREGCSMHIRNGVSLPVGSRDFEDLLGKVLASRGISQNVPEWAERLAEDISNYTD